ncbi:hypothetical protein [Pseudomonas sp. Ag1]|uniref:hypothetical protein n=1 Tax=Pseudomonas sp. Ag1 TaxID=1197727 RepID=UPI000A021040
MPLTKPNQYLQGVASDLKWSSVELMRIAERLSLAGVSRVIYLIQFYDQRTLLHILMGLK